MSNKIKIYDSIFFKGEVELLLFRLTELGESIKSFIVMEIGEDDTSSVFLKNIKLFDRWIDKIIHVYANEEDSYDVLKKTYISLKPNFDDILMVSKTNELPDLSHIGIFHEKLKFNYFILNHYNFFWNKDYINVNLSKGSFGVSLSLLLQHKSLFKMILGVKNKEGADDTISINNGWKFSNFNYMSEYEYNISEKLPIEEINPITTYPLIKHNGNIPLPKNLDLLPYIPIGRDNVKKHLFLVECDIEFMEGYDTITIIKFSSNLQEKLCERVSEKITKSALYLPNIVLYGDSDLETFQNEYMLNETKRMFSVVFPQEQDIIDVFFKNEKPLGLGGV
jgi:hypothetical protein